jgi:hypothetical protein
MGCYIELIGKSFGYLENNISGSAHRKSDLAWKSTQPTWPFLLYMLARTQAIQTMPYCHTRFLRPKPYAHRMYDQDQVVMHMVRM